MSYGMREGTLDLKITVPPELQEAPEPVQREVMARLDWAVGATARILLMEAPPEDRAEQFEVYAERMPAHEQVEEDGMVRWTNIWSQEVGYIPEIRSGESSTLRGWFVHATWPGESPAPVYRDEYGNYGFWV